MIINQATIAKVTTGFKTVFNTAFDQAPSDYEKVTMVVPSSARAETYGWLGATTRFREWLGDRVIQNLEAHDYEIKNRSFENTIGVDRDDLEDDSYGTYAPLVAQLGQDARAHPDQLVFGLLNAGFTGLGYDGVPFFSSDHPVTGPDGLATTASNSGGGSGTAWFLLDTSRRVRPLIFQRRRDYAFVRRDDPTDESVFARKQILYGVDCRVNAGYGLWQLAYGSRQTLDATGYGTARASMLGLLGDHGQPLGIRPSLLVVPPALEAEGRELLTAERDGAGATNIWRGSAELLVTPWLA